MAAHAPITSSVTKFALTAFLLAALTTTGAEARGWFGAGESASKESIALSDLPVQGQKTYQTIMSGGPFRFDKDGTVFGNRERILPPARRGHYREYTVPTPGARNRGAQRIVCGGEQRTTPEACWYTADHYASFRRIAP